MKKQLFLLLFVSLSTLAFSQKKVAVYAPEEYNSGFDTQTKEFVVGEFIRAINKSSEYIAVNRSKEFEQGISSERSYQNSGLVDEKEIAQLGKESGVSYVCVVVFRRVLGERNIEARLIDVTRADVIASDNRPINYSNATTLQNDAAAIAKTLMNGGIAVKSENEMLTSKGFNIYINDSKLVNELDARRLFRNSKAIDYYDKGMMIYHSEFWNNNGDKGLPVLELFGVLGLTIGGVVAGICYPIAAMDEGKRTEEDLESLRNIGGLGLKIAITGAALCLLNNGVKAYGKMQIRKAVNAYNNGTLYSHNSLELKYGFMGNGLFLSLNF